jgi:hypothetical protein
MFLPDCDLTLYPKLITFFGAAFTAYLFDFLIRPVVDKHIKGYTLARVKWPSPMSIASNTIGLEWFVHRMMELVYTTKDFHVFAKDCGWSGPPFRWDEERRFKLRCELDAAFFHLYLPAEANGEWRKASREEGCPYDETPEQLAELKKHFPTPRDALAYVMDTFPIARRKDEEKFDGDYRTKRVILEIYDAMQESIRTGKPYQTRLDPPPADPRVAHLSPGQRRPVGEAYELVDLLHVDLTGETVPVRLPAEWRVPGDESVEIVRFKFPAATGKPLQVGDLVILRHPALRQGDLAIAVAVGEIRSIQDQRNPQTQERVVLVLLKTAGAQVGLELPATEWDSFRPLAVKDE